MRRFWPIGVLIALTALAGGQQPDPPQEAPAQAQPQPKAAPEPVRVKVYDLRSNVVPPRLLPMDTVFPWSKSCKNDWDGEVELSLLVDTAGMPRNIMFSRPIGTFLDRVALEVVGYDRFQPGTFDGKPVVVAVNLHLNLKTCVDPSQAITGKSAAVRVFRAEPSQKIIKPKNPIQEAVLAPLETPAKGAKRKVSRTEYFGNGKSAPALIYSVDARYTPSKPGAQITGICKVSLIVDANGLPENVRVLKSLDPGLDRSALEAVDLYRFFPAIENEHPVPSAIVVDVNFAPPEDFYAPSIDE